MFLEFRDLRGAPLTQHLVSSTSLQHNMLCCILWGIRVCGVVEEALVSPEPRFRTYWTLGHPLGRSNFGYCKLEGNAVVYSIS